jgi:hypothetical protein
MFNILKNKKFGKGVIVAITMIIGLYFSVDTFVLHKDDKKKNEDYYQTILCDRLVGIKEHRLSDKTRVDCLTEEYAIEVDWAKKWAEGIGQALFYAQMTNKKPAVALIVGKKDKKYLKRLKLVADKLDIKVIKINKQPNKYAEDHH